MIRIQAHTRLKAGRETGSGAGFLPYCPATNRFFLMQRSNTGDEGGTYCGPGGGVEEGESPDEAARREASEECGFPEDAPCNLHYMGCIKSPDFEFHNFLGVVPSEFEPTLNHEHVSGDWYTKEEMAELDMHPGLLEAMEGPEGKALMDRMTNINEVA